MAMSVLDNVPVPLVLLDDDLEIQYSNPAFNRLFGRSFGDAPVHNFASYEFSEEVISELRTFAKAKDDEESNSRVFDIAVQDGDPEPRVMLMEIHKVDEGSHAYVLTMIDISDRLLAEARIRELQVEHIDLSKKAAMSELATTIAHELNQPLSAIINYNRACAQTLRSSGAAIPQEIYETLDKAIDQVNRAAAIIRNLREYIEQEDLEFAEEDLEQVVGEAAELACSSKPEVPIQFAFTCAPGLRPILINRVQIQQVVMNLVGNAIEAMESAADKVLSVSIGAWDDDFVEVAISDTGSGIPDHILGRVFDPFVSNKEEGLGMGLAICSTIVARHGGEIWVERNGDQGTVFRFTLPVTLENGTSRDAE